MIHFSYPKAQEGLLQPMIYIQWCFITALTKMLNKEKKWMVRLKDLEFQDSVFVIKIVFVAEYWSSDRL